MNSIGYLSKNSVLNINYNRMNISILLYNKLIESVQYPMSLLCLFCSTQYLQYEIDN